MVGRWVKQGVGAGLVGALAVAGSVAFAAPAQASCVPSEAAVQPAVVAPGQRVMVSSSNWFGICNDTGQKVDVTDSAVVTFVQGSRHVLLGRTNSNAAGVFNLVVRIPRRATAGAAVLEVRGRSAFDDLPITVTAATLPITGGGPAIALLATLALGAAAAVHKATHGAFRP